MKNLAIILSRLKVFDKPDFTLEQYPTDSEIAFEVLHNADMHNEINDKNMLDLGAGAGILGIGCLLLGAKRVYFVDKDKKALNILKKNLLLIEKQLSIKLIDKAVIIEKDVSMIDSKDFKDIDLIVQNPPFGTKNKGIDTMFLKKAMEISSIVYSFHKFETREYVERIINSNGFKLSALWRFKFLLRNTMSYHTKNKEYIDVGCFKIIKSRM